MDAGGNADIILQHLLWHPNNLVLGPNESSLRGEKPGNNLDLELLKAQPKQTQEFFHKLDTLKSSPKLFFEKYSKLHHVKIRKVDWILGDAKKKQEKDKYYVDDRPNKSNNENSESTNYHCLENEPNYLDLRQLPITETQIIGNADGLIDEPVDLIV